MKIVLSITIQTCHVFGAQIPLVFAPDAFKGKTKVQILILEEQFEKNFLHEQEAIYGSEEAILNGVRVQILTFRRLTKICQGFSFSCGLSS